MVGYFYAFKAINLGLLGLHFHGVESLGLALVEEMGQLIPWVKALKVQAHLEKVFARGIFCR